MQVNLRLLKAAALAVLTITLSASFVGGRQESKILKEQHIQPSQIYKNDIDIKGKTYYIDETDWWWYEGSKYIFLVGCAVLLAMIVAGKSYSAK